MSKIYSTSFLKKLKTCFVLAIVLLLPTQSYALDVGNKAIIGNFEKVAIMPTSISFKAKIDTGAKNSSMHATDIEYFFLNKKEHIRFKTQNLQNETRSIELPVERIAKIKRHGGSSQKRPVVLLGICLGSVYKRIEVTLTDRSKFKARFLIGVSFIEDSFVVDVSQNYTQKPSCNSLSS